MTVTRLVCAVCGEVYTWIIRPELAESDARRHTARFGEDHETFLEAA